MGAAAAGRVSRCFDFPEFKLGEREIFDFDAVFVPGNGALPGDVSVLFFWFFCDAWIGGTLRDDRSTPAGRGADPALDRAFWRFTAGAFWETAPFDSSAPGCILAW